MKIDYNYYEQDKQTSKHMKSNEEAKELARQMVGDGQSPNMWFVTVGPYIAEQIDAAIYGEGMRYVLIEGYDREKDTRTYGPFETYEAALECYDDHSLDINYGVGQAFIEDRKNGMVKEKWLTKRVSVEYEEEEIDDTKLFYKK